VVVLDELAPDPELLERAAAVGLGEEPALVAVHGGLDEDRTLEAGLQAAHGAGD